MSVDVVDGRFVLEPGKPRVGGTARVHRARDYENGSAIVALKLFEGPALEDAVLEEFFLREREALEALKHPNIVELRAAGFDPDRDQYYVALEWLDEALLDYIKRCEEEGVGEERNPGAGWDSFSQLTLVPLLDGLAMAHSRRIWHRDIKPQNVMMDPDGRPKLADFGLAKVVDSLRFGLTVRDFYSRPYSAPERLHGELDQRSDLYSLGVTALRCLLPRDYQLEDNKIASALDDADVPDDARHFLAQLVATAPEDRFPSTKIAQAELRRLLVWRPSVGADGSGTVRLKLTQRAIEEIAVYIAETSPDVVTKYILRDLSDESDQTPASATRAMAAGGGRLRVSRTGVCLHHAI